MNGIRNGKGKEYYFDYQLKFEDEKIEDGEKFDFKFGLMFEGEYLNGIKHGKAKEYDKNGNLIFEGNYFYGQRCNFEK